MQKKLTSFGRTLPSSISGNYYRIFNDENIQWKHYSNTLKFFKDYNKTKLAAATKNLKTNYNFFIKTNMLFINSKNKKINDKFLKLTLTILNKYWHSVTFFAVKFTPETYLEPSQTSTINLFLWFSRSSSTIDVRLGSKYASPYIYLQVSPIEIIYILNILL